MLVADTYVGNREDAAVMDRLSDADPHQVVLEDTDWRRSRVRTETERGRDLGIVVARELADGDILETESGDLVVVAIATVEALVVDFADADVAPARTLEVGHVLGNRHWDLAVRGEEVLFPVADTRERTEATVADLLPANVTIYFEQVPPTTFDDATPAHAHNTRREDGHNHSHEHGHDHSHGQDNENWYGHSHSYRHNDSGDYDDYAHARDHGVFTVEEDDRD